MKKTLLWLSIAVSLIGAGILPGKGRDASELLPVRVLHIRMEGSMVFVKGDNGAEGAGKTLERAFLDMERSANGILFLDTAEHILLEEGARELTGQTVRCARLRPAAKLYWTRNVEANEETEKFLRAHPTTVTLGNVRAARCGAGEIRVPRLVETEGRLRLFEG